MSSEPILVLGTAQLGEKYGIQNVTESHDIEKAKDMVKKCISNGIYTFDTARAYGDSEFILGQILPRIYKMHNDGEMSHRPHVITKVHSLKEEEYMNADLRIKAIETSIAQSLSHLNMLMLDTLLLHSFNDYIKYKDIWEFMQTCQKQDKVMHLGCSIYTVQEAIQLLTDSSVAHIQIPVNILDSQWNDPTFLDLVNTRRLENNNRFTIHCRSIFLQGILIAETDNLPTAAVINYDILPVINKMETFVKRWGLSCRVELCIAYVKALGWVDGIILGADNIDQLQQNIDIFESSRALTNNELIEVQRAFVNIPRSLLNPYNWNV